MADQTEDAPKKQPVRKKAAAPRKRATSNGPRPSRAGASARPNAVKVARSAQEQLRELLGEDSETVIGVQRTDDGWQVDLEVVETQRIPDTTDVLAIYRVQLDDAGDVQSYQRLDRYIRGKGEGGVPGA